MTASLWFLLYLGIGVLVTFTQATHPRTKAALQGDWTVWVGFVFLTIWAWPVAMAYEFWRNRR